MNIVGANITNPYFKAFVFEKKLKEGSEYKGYEYLFWIDNKWMEWCKTTGSNYNEPKNEKEHALFKEWLFKIVGYKNISI